MSEDRSSSSSSPDPAVAEEQNYSLKEEIVHLDQLLVDSHAEADDTANRMEKLTEEMEVLLNQESGASEDDDEDFSNEIAEHQKEVRNHLEEELTKYKSQVSSYQSVQQEQAKIIDDMQNRIEEYRFRCARLEAAITDASLPLEAPNDVSQHLEDRENVEALQLKLVQEKGRCERLSQINALYREQLEMAKESNEALNSDIDRMSKEWESTKMELKEKESTWQKEEQSFSTYVTKEHHRLLSLWHHIQYCRTQFIRMKHATEKDLSAIKSQIQSTSQNVTDSCIRLSLSASVTQTNNNGELIQEVLRLNHEMFIMKQTHQSEKAILNERLNDLSSEQEKKQLLLENKTLGTIIRPVDSTDNFNQESTSGSEMGSRQLISTSRCCVAVKEIGQIILDDAEHRTWAGNRSSSLTSIKKALLSSTQHSQTSICENTEFLDSTVASVQNALHKRRLQIEKMNLEIVALKERTSTQEKMINSLTADRQILSQSKSKLLLQLETMKNNAREVVNDKEKLQSFLKDTGSHTSFLEHTRRSLNSQIEKLNAENDRLYQTQNQLYQRLETVQQEKDKLLLSEQSLTMDLSLSNKKISVIEDRLKEIEKRYQESQRKLEKVSMDNELLLQEKDELNHSFCKYEKQHSDLDAKIILLQKNADSLQESMLSLKALNEALTKDKQELNQSLTEALSESESLKLKMARDRTEFEKDKRELKGRHEMLQQKCTELEVETGILKNSLSELESSRAELEEAQSIIVQRNSSLINQVTKMSHQKDLMEKEIEQNQKETKARLECSEKVLEQRETLAREKSEMTVKINGMDNEISRLTETVAVLRSDKEKLEKAFYSSQQLSMSLRDDKSDVEEEINDLRSKYEHLQAQMMELKRQKEIDFDTMACQKNDVNQKLQQSEQEYNLTLKNLQQQHKLDLDILLQEKESQRKRLEVAQEELAKHLQLQIEDLVQRHSEEISLVRKKSVLHEQEVEQRLFASLDEKSSREKILLSEKSSLEHLVEELLQKISTTESGNQSSQQETLLPSEHYETLIEEKEKEFHTQKEELENLISRHAETTKVLEAQIEDLKQMKDVAYKNMEDVTKELDSNVFERNNLQRRLEQISGGVDDDKKTIERLEQQIMVLQQKLDSERRQVELAKVSQEDLKARLRKIQSDNNEMKYLIHQKKQKIQSLESTSTHYLDEIKDMKDTLRELEASRLEARRETQNLRRCLVVSEATNESKTRELNEIQVLMARSDEVEMELRKDISNMKQRLMEAEASKEASMKEMSNMQRKLQDMETRLKLKQEEHNLSLQEALSGELSHTEQRLNIEKSLTTAMDDVQQLRLKLNYSEGKVVAFEKQISKLEGVKRDLENKLHAIQLSLRSFLGLNSDSGFRGSSTQLLMSPFSSRRDSPSKFADYPNPSTRESSPFRDHQPATTSTPIQPEFALGVGDLDIDLIRSALSDFVRKLFNTEKERDDLRSNLNRMQQELNNVIDECKVHEEKVHQVQREIEIIKKDKKDFENQLSVSRSSVTHLEDLVKNLETEKKEILETNNTLLQERGLSESEKNILQNKLGQLHQNEILLKQERLQLTEARDTAETRAVRTEVTCYELENEKENLQEALKKKSLEMEPLRATIEELKTSLQATEVQKNSLQMSVDRLNAALEKYVNNENVFREKLKNLEMSLSEGTMTTQQLNKDLLQLKREHGSCEQEKSFLRNETETQRGILTEMKLNNRRLEERVDALVEAAKDFEFQKAELEGQIQGFKNVLSYNEDSERNLKERMHDLEGEKYHLEEQLNRTKMSISKNDDLRIYSEKQKQKFDKENALLRKALDKVEKERQKTEEVASRSVMERAALGKSLSKMEIENQQLMQKIQSLQVQMVEVEQRHLDRIKAADSRQKYDMQLELERLKTSQRHIEQLLLAKEKSHREKIIGLEQQIEILQDHLRQAHSPWIQRVPTRSASVTFLNHVSNEELQKAEATPKKSPSQQIPLRSSASAPQPRHLSSPNQRLPSASHVRRRLDKSFES